MKWWQLPGPASFVNEISDELRSGSNVILQLPSCLPTGLRSAIADNLGSSVPITTIDADGVASVFDFLFDHYTSGTETRTLRNASTLVQHIHPGFIYWLTGITCKNWPAWRVFLSEYQHACGNRAVLERTLFCVMLEGDVAEATITPEVRLSLLRYDNRVSRLDALIFSSLLLERSTLESEVLWEVRAAIIAQLALWDPDAATRLAANVLDNAFEPEIILAKMAKERGWTDLDLKNEQSLWSHGAGMRFQGEFCLHAAYLASAKLNDEIARRVWTGQVGILFPYIEGVRRQFLQRYQHAFRLPQLTARGSIHDIHDLEIGHIYSQLQQMLASGKDRYLAERLTTMRNALAHLECVPMADLIQILGRG